MSSGTDRRVAGLLNRLPPAVRGRFAHDPVGTLTDVFGFRVVAAPQLDQQRDDGGHCDGVSFFDSGVILYAPTKSKRQHFTLAHELGHWLIDQTPGFYDWIGDHPSPMAVIENLCDRVAQQLLLPDEVIDRVISRGPVRAEHVRALNRESNASRAASCIALCRRLPGAGAAAFASRETGEIEYSSIQPHPEHGWPTVYPWPGQALPHGGPFLDLGTGEHVTRLATWYAPWRTTAEYYVDAEADDYYLYLLFSDTDLWTAPGSFVAKPLEFDSRPRQTIVCCGAERTARGYPCARCGQIACPQCGDCRCEKRQRRDVRCRQCNALVLPHLLDPAGLCEICA